jgi:hypothetical protein
MTKIEQTETEKMGWQLEWHSEDGQRTMIASDVYADFESAERDAGAAIDMLIRESGADEEQAESFRDGKIKIIEARL